MTGQDNLPDGSGSVVDETVWRGIEAFYRREILLLQERRYREWLQLMDDRIEYRVPVTTSTNEGLIVADGAIGYYDEDAELLEARVAKLESKQSWVENPPSRLRYFVQLLDVQKIDDNSWLARSNLLLFQSRWNLDQQFTGDRLDVLNGSEAGLKLRSRTVTMDRQVFTHQGLSVFF